MGKHYSIRWTEEDLKKEVKESSKLCIDQSQKRKLNLNSQAVQNDVSKIYSEGRKLTTHNESENDYGPLTQRLISALVEQNLMTPFDTEIVDMRMEKQDELYLSPKALASKFHSSLNQNLERKIKRELIEQGL